MKKLIIFSALTYIFGCETLNDFSIPTNKYPTNLGKEWEYNSIWYFEYYDSTGHIDSVVTQDLGNTIVRIVNDHEFINSYDNAILFESFDLNTPQYVGKIWYVNSDSGFFSIAYSDPGVTQPVLPKRKITRTDVLNYLIKTNGMQLGFGAPDFSQIYNSDSIQIYSPPRKVFEYPLRVGMNWIEFTSPLLKERFVSDYENVFLNGKTYNCFKIVSSIESFGIKLIDYVDLNSGMIMREIGSDSIAITSFISPDSVIGYYKSTTISKLARTRN
jgi:hypothetical protein